MGQRIPSIEMKINYKLHDNIIQFTKHFEQTQLHIK